MKYPRGLGIFMYRSGGGRERGEGILQKILRKIVEHSVLAYFQILIIMFFKCLFKLKFKFVRMILFLKSRFVWYPSRRRPHSFVSGRKIHWLPTLNNFSSQIWLVVFRCSVCIRLKMLNNYEVSNSLPLVKGDRCTWTILDIDWILYFFWMVFSAN